MKKSMFTKVLIIALAIMVVGTVAFIGGCGSDSNDDGAAAPTVKRTMASAFRSDAAYQYIHGTNSPDGTKLYVAFNNTISAGSGTLSGNFTAYMLNMSDVTAGTVSSSSVLATSQSITAATAFRQSFTPDGTKIVQAGADRVVVLKASDLSVLQSTTNIGGTSTSFQSHDALAIDNDYALLQLQSKQSTTGVAAVILYNINTGATIGSQANTCSPCHSWTSAKSHMNCGIDGKFTKGSDGKYTGTLYASTTTGGHIVKVNLTIDPATGVTAGSASHLAQVSNYDLGTGAAGTDIPNLHDVRLDTTVTPNRVYYSAIMPDATGGANNGRVHMGYVETTTGNKTDATINIASGSTSAPVYCGSGQTTTHFIPQTMNYPAYIDAVPKSLITTGAALNP